MLEPPKGWTTDIEIKKVYDGDTVVVEIKRELTVRLMDCWCSEIRTRNKKEKTKGIAARNHLRKILFEKKEIDTGKLAYTKATLHIPADDENQLKDIFTFGRVLGYIFVGGKNISEVMVESGHATKTKSGK